MILDSQHDKRMNVLLFTRHLALRCKVYGQGSNDSDIFSSSLKTA